MLEKLKCALGQHERSGRQARRDGATIVSVCKHCGVPMRRIAKGKWEVIP